MTSPRLRAIGATAGVKNTERTGDFVATLFISVGSALFFFGRHALTAIAQGKYKLPPGYTWVARAEMHDRQTTVGMRLVIAGAVIACLSAAYHAWRKRRVSE